MSIQRRPEVERLFNEALERPAGPERDAFLDGACGSDADLRTRVEELLAAHDEAGSFLQSPAVAPPERTAEGPGARIGRYKLLQRIGEGGMGAVYMAEQEEPVRRKVALKIIKLGMDTRQVIARFEAERQALALMDHPNIARVLDAGSTDTGRPYFVMELVRGIPIHEYCDKNQVSTRDRLRLFLPVCAAVQHAHQRGIIHRDLKPTNVLVTLHDGVPVPKVIDFGIAKATNQRLTERTLFTEYRQLIGTPEYMSPEQAEMSGLDVDTRTDVYSLGVLLYELLTGTTPFDARTLREAGYAEFQRILREEEPEPLSTRVGSLAGHDDEVARRRHAEPAALRRLYRGDLDWIVLKALEKDRTRRYGSAGELAEDLARHLRHQAVLASPPGALYRLRKFVRRNSVPVLAGGLATLALVAGLALATAGLLRARHEARRSQTIADFLTDMLVSTDPEEAVGQDLDVRAVLATAREVFGDDHATVAATLSSRAAQLQSTGNWAAAEPLQREALRLWRDAFGPEHAHVGLAYGRLGTLLRIKGDDPAAEQAYREALRLLDDDHLAAADAGMGLAEVLQNRGAHEEAVEALTRALAIRRATAPHQKMAIATTANAVANALVLSHRLDDAEPWVEETLAAFRDALPPRSTVMAKVTAQIGGFFFERGRYDEAESLCREAIDICIANDEREAIWCDVAFSYLSRIVSERDDGTPDYIDTRLEYLAYVRAHAAPESALRRMLPADYAAWMVDHGRPLDALPLAREALELMDKHGDASGRRETASRAFANACWAVAREPDRPRAEYETARAAVEEFLERVPESAAAVNTRGVLEYRLGRPRDALAVLARSDAHHAAGPWGGAPADSALLAMAHHRLGNGVRALAEFYRLCELMEVPELARDEWNRALFAEASRTLDTPAGTE